MEAEAPEKSYEDKRTKEELLAEIQALQKKNEELTKYSLSLQQTIAKAKVTLGETFTIKEVGYLPPASLNS